VGAVAFAFILGACGGSSHTTPNTVATPTDAVASSTTVATSTTLAGPTDASVAPKVLAILTHLEKEPANLTTSQTAIILSTAAQQLQSIQFPANAQSDAKALIKDFNTMSADASLGNMSQFETDAATAHADDDALRSDLGLPPAPTS
jgi:hypothetical protein